MIKLAVQISEKYNDQSNILAKYSLEYIARVRVR